MRTLGLTALLALIAMACGRPWHEGALTALLLIGCYVLVTDPDRGEEFEKEDVTL